MRRPRLAGGTARRQLRLVGSALLLTSIVIADGNGRAGASLTPTTGATITVHSGGPNPPAMLTATPTGLGATPVTLPEYIDDETLRVSASGFDPGAAVFVEECQEPEALAANLPATDASCDGNTLATQLSDSVSGNLSNLQVTLYSLPSTELGETSTAGATCDLTDPCVLYIGQSQGDIAEGPGTWYTWSSPFWIQPLTPQSITFTSTIPSPRPSAPPTPSRPAGAPRGVP